MNLEKRLDAAGRYIRDLRVRMAPVTHGIGHTAVTPPPWMATLSTDCIGVQEATFTCYADSPADAIDLVLKAASEWVAKQRDLR